MSNSNNKPLGSFKALGIVALVIAVIGISASSDSQETHNITPSSKVVPITATEKVPAKSSPAPTPTPAPAPAPAPTPTPSAHDSNDGCNPNYSGCVENSSYDLDCSDIGHQVRVIGNDEYSLDRDGDGYGCDSY